MAKFSTDLDRAFSALADPTRWRVLVVLAGLGEATATTLANELPISRQAIVKHLTVLDRAGLVSSQRAGREVLYVVHPERLDETARWLSRVALDWDRRLAVIKRIAESGDVRST